MLKSLALQLAASTPVALRRKVAHIPANHDRTQEDPMEQLFFLGQMQHRASITSQGALCTSELGALHDARTISGQLIPLFKKFQ
jgi:hypothetical protein